MNDSQYNLIADELLIAVEDAVENLDDYIDYETAGGMIELIFKDGSKIIINKQEPLHQIWVATKFNGHHFELKDEKWIDKRGAGEFWQFLTDAATKQAGIAVDLNH